MFEPDENVMDDDTIETIICSATIDWETYKFPKIVVSVFTTNPLFGDIMASAEPDFNLSRSPIASTGIFSNCDPSPLNAPSKRDAETVLLGTKTSSVISISFSMDSSVDTCKFDAVKLLRTSTPVGLKSTVLLPLTVSVKRLELN